MIEEILPNLYRIEIPLPRNPLKYLNSYLIKGRERNLLIDTGFNQEECKTAMFEGLGKLEVNLEETDLFVTHLHADHTGLVSALVTDNSKVYCGEIDANLINRCVPSNCCGLSHFLSEMHEILALHGFPLQEIDNAIQEHPARKQNIGRKQDFSIVKENDTIEVGDYIFKCVETPGHSPGHMCLYETKKEILISGDHILDEITPIIKITKWASDPLGDFLNSLDKIYQMEISLTLPAHRRIIKNIYQRIYELKLHHESRLNEVLSILDNCKMNAYQVASKMTWDVKYTSWERFPATQKYFATTEAASHLIYLCNINKVRKIDSEGKLLFELIN